MKKNFLFLALVAIIGTACMDNKNNCNNCNSAPLPFVFTLLPSENGTSMINDTTFVPDSIRLYYLNNNVERSVNFVFITSAYLGSCIYTTDISNISAGTNVKTFYLYLNHNETDTIYFDSKIVNDGCCTYYQYDSLAYNSKKMPFNSDYGVYYFLKNQPK